MMVKLAIVHMISCVRCGPSTAIFVNASKAGALAMFQTGSRKSMHSVNATPSPAIRAE